MNLLVHRISGPLSLRPAQHAAMGVLGRTVELAAPAKGADVGAARETVRSEFPSG